MSTHTNQPSAVLPSFINLSMSEAGLTSKLNSFANMDYLIVDTSNPMNFQQGTSPVDVTDAWDVTVTVLYFGTEQSVIDNFNTEHVGPWSAMTGPGDGVTLKNYVISVVEAKAEA